MLMNGKTCLITGATSGIGRETALQLAQLGAQVVVSGRSEQKAKEVVEQINGTGAVFPAEYLVADLADQSQVRDLVAQFKDRHDRLDVLINNAGGIFRDFQQTNDGHEMTWSVNHLAPFALTMGLLDRLEAAAPSRVINVTSGLHARKGTTIDEPAFDEPYRPFSAYSRSKLASVLFTYALARRLEGTGVSVNCLHPGVVATGFGHNNGGLFSLFMTLARPFLRTVDTGAQTSVFLASSSEVDGVTGKFFVDCDAVPSSPSSYDIGLQERLWDMSLADIDPAI